eukprot:CAMPEP_0205877932 /NCGR_PEP_ID=MMETSP1083-20121108/14583_1 /ASSEMBLY_ACC=CAM_ASM_000430 /TAXON_ID=97485 /ORGANISM="Prymnesium parvum, Strain Texoma1" /LENGTH=156 /DNA_ID=CAMNT_0053240769 /DNA_START=382 /DNA_END=850 /DNA_ORIENTATION=-
MPRCEKCFAANDPTAASAPSPSPVTAATLGPAVLLYRAPVTTAAPAGLRRSSVPRHEYAIVLRAASRVTCQVRRADVEGEPLAPAPAIVLLVVLGEKEVRLYGRPRVCLSGEGEAAKDGNDPASNLSGGGSAPSLRAYGSARVSGVAIANGGGQQE